jgi:hypothetical protein
MSRRLAAISLASALVVAVLSVASPVQAAVPAAPSGLQPDGTQESRIPVLSWGRVSGAVSYDVQVARPGGFDTPLWKADRTTNRQAVPDKQLPSGELVWRVRSRGADSRTSAWSQATFTRDSLAGPSPISPTNDAMLEQPSQPALLSWTPVRGATGYTVHVGTDPNFVDSALFKSYSTRTSSYVVPDPMVATRYYWRVQADMGNGIVTDWSTPQNFQIGGLAKPVLVGPDDSPATDVKDVVLEWQPVLGAKTYNLQISTDQNFNTLVSNATVQNITGTRYSPSVTLGNDQYYWRVTPVDAAGNKLDWLDVDIWTFRRHWPDQPALEYPGDQAVVGDPFYYQWTPVTLASSYRIELSKTSDFNPPLADTCVTTNTTYVPLDRDDCHPSALGTYYWRVVALDDPAGIVSDSIAAEARRFTYDPARVQLVSPASGSTVETPTLTWNPVAGAAKYKVTITATDGGAGGGSFTTTATSFTPRAKLTVGKTYRWQVQTVSQSLREGASLLVGSQRSFTVAASTATAGATPEPITAAGTSGSRFPTLEWTEVTGATSYRILVRAAGTPSGYLPVGGGASGDSFGYAAGEDDTSTWLSPDTYQWMVVAYNGSAQISQSVSTSTFTIRPPAQVSGESLAMSGLALEDDSTSCTNALDPAEPLADQQCVDLRATPVLSWDADPEVGYYRVWLSRDQQLTNVVDDYPVEVETTHFTPRTSLIDSQAGSAFYWFVQPCKVDGKCAALQHAQHAFNKLSKPVETLSPGLGDVQANDITFTWRDYLATNQDPSVPSSPAHTGVYSIEPGVEARQYRIQVDSEPNFQEPLLESAVVDQTTYTSVNNTYPEGPLYWRVQAIDGSVNSLTWSAPVPFTKASPTVDLLAPVSNETVSGAAPLRWTPLAYAASYDVEVYKNGDVIGMPDNRVVAGTSKQVAYSLASPLAVADSSYTWRVRPVDAKGRKGPWTSLEDLAARFRVVGQTPTPVLPEAGTYVDEDDALFTWDPVDRAATYRFERRFEGVTSSAEIKVTAATAWAPTSPIADGSWEWRVSAQDATGAVIKSSAWTDFEVDSTRPTVASVSPRTSATRTANFGVRFSEAVEGVSPGTYRIYKSGSTSPLTATVTPNSTGTKATLNPASNLKVGSTYILKLTSKIRDEAGNKLTAYSWRVKVN